MVDSKAVMNLAELTDAKAKFRQWNVKLLNTLKHLNKGYAWAMERSQAEAARLAVWLSEAEEVARVAAG